MMIAADIPMTQARKVLQGISGSFVLATAERTSGYGESLGKPPVSCGSMVACTSGGG